MRDVCGVQAQDSDAAALAISARCPGLVTADVERALVEERSTVRTWCTLHLIAAEASKGIVGATRRVAPTQTSRSR